MRGGTGKGGEQIPGGGVLGAQGDAAETDVRKLSPVGRYGTDPRGQGGQGQTWRGAGAQHTGHRRHPTEHPASGRDTARGASVGLQGQRRSGIR